jgi:hypothetical protein
MTGGASAREVPECDPSGEVVHDPPASRTDIALLT